MMNKGEVNAIKKESINVKFLQLSSSEYLNLFSPIQFYIYICMYWDTFCPQLYDHNSCKCFPLIVFDATIPGLFVSKGFGWTNVFWLVETNCLL